MSNDIKHHISVYKKVFIALLILTILTVLASYFEFGGIVWLAVGIGLAIATFKAYLVAANFMHLAHPIDQDDWMVQYIALNGPGFIPGNVMGYQWFDLYPNGIYIADAGPREFQQIQKEIDFTHVGKDPEFKIQKISFQNTLYRESL